VNALGDSNFRCPTSQLAVVIGTNASITPSAFHWMVAMKLVGRERYLSWRPRHDSSEGMMKGEMTPKHQTFADRQLIIMLAPILTIGAITMLAPILTIPLGPAFRLH